MSDDAKLGSSQTCVFWGVYKTSTVPSIFSDIMKSKSNPDFLKTDRSCVGRQLRGLRSKVSLGARPGCAEPTRGCTEGPQGASSHAHPTGSVPGLQAECPLHSSRTASSVTAGLLGAVLPSGLRLTRLQFTLMPSTHFLPLGPLPRAPVRGKVGRRVGCPACCT